MKPLTFNSLVYFLRTSALVMFYYTFSISLTFYNKWMMKVSGCSGSFLQDCLFRKRHFYRPNHVLYVHFTRPFSRQRIFYLSPRDKRNAWIYFLFFCLLILLFRLIEFLLILTGASCIAPSVMVRP